MHKQTQNFVDFDSEGNPAETVNNILIAQGFTIKPCDTCKKENLVEPGIASAKCSCGGRI